MPTLQNTTDVNIIFVCRTNSTLVVRVDFEASISRGTNWLYVVKAQETKNVLSDTLLQIVSAQQKYEIVSLMRGVVFYNYHHIHTYRPIVHW